VFIHKISCDCETVGPRRLLRDENPGAFNQELLETQALIVPPWCHEVWRVMVNGW